MKDRFFIDSNVLVCYFQKEGTLKKRITRELLGSDFNKFFISVQVLGELFNVLRRLGMSSDNCISVVRYCEHSFKTRPISYVDVDQALNIHKKYQYSYYDSLIISTSLQSKCTVLYSEDMQHNQIIEKKLKIINPFGD